MDDRLKNTLDKIFLLCKQNSEFYSELRKGLEMFDSGNQVNLNDFRIENIERYLGLDFSVDAKDSIIDYSYITIPDVKSQLISDNREMMRFRYGTRYHKIDFNEFCRYAHFQAEMLLNYYYDIINEFDTESIKNHIKQYNEKAKIDDVASLNSIPYNVKVWAFCNEYKINKINRELLDNIKKVRNELSHRSAEIDQFEIVKYQERLKNIGFKLKGLGEIYINWKDKQVDLELKEIYKREIQNSMEYRQYRYLLWYHSVPFDGVIQCIKQLSCLVSTYTCA